MKKTISMTRFSGPGHGISVKHFSRQDFFSIFVLLALCLTLFFFRIGARPLWDVDEGMHAATSKEMVLSGDWVITTFNGKPFYDKPAFHNWLVAISFVIFGFTEFAARLPAAIVGSACVFATYLLGRRMLNPLTGFCGAAILATSLEFIMLSRTIVHDISLAFFMTLALCFFYLGFTSLKNRTSCFLLLYIALGLAVLSKGPIGVLLPTLIIGLFLIFKGELGFLKELKLGWGILIFLVVTAPWYILIVLRDPEYAAYFFIQKNLMAFFSKTSRHSEPFYFYLPILLLGFFPWSCLLPYAVVRHLRWPPKKMPDGILFILLWFGSILLFFSLSRSKLPTYILPLFPAMALLVGYLWHELIEIPSRSLRKGFCLSYIPILILGFAALFYILIRPPMEWETESGIDMTHLTMAIMWVIGALLAAFFLFLRRYYRAFFYTTVSMVVGTLLFAILVIIPSVNPYRSTKTPALKLDQMLAEDEKMVFYHRLQDSALFYTNRKGVVLDNPKDLDRFLASKKNAFCIIQQKHLDRLESQPKVFHRTGDRLILTK
jgi:4-amino-4-deoxy-L-arabinose transferase-like glycosyltransferase